MDIVREILSAPTQPPPWTTLDAWWQSHRDLVAAAAVPVDAAIRGGFAGERLAAAFVAGYQAALRALVSSLPTDQIVSLCVTERGGAHPRAVHTRLEPSASGTYTITGDKRWATVSSHAGLFIVIVHAGDDAEKGRPLLRAVRVDPRAKGVTLTHMPETSFVPEIPHAEISFDHVLVTEQDILPGDAYDRYVKPFRTVEDVHIHIAVAAYLVRVCRNHSLERPLVARLAHLVSSLRTIATSDPADPATHIVLAGAFDEMHRIVADLDDPLARAAPDEHSRFVRDKALFGIASRARVERTERAWQRLS